jgi:hypothetical protein
MIAAVRNPTIRVATAVPKTFAASLAPSDHPRKSPLDRKRRIIRQHRFRMTRATDPASGDPRVYLDRTLDR